MAVAKPTATVMVLVMEDGADRPECTTLQRRQIDAWILSTYRRMPVRRSRLWRFLRNLPPEEQGHDRRTFNNSTRTDVALA